MPTSATGATDRPVVVGDRVAAYARRAGFTLLELLVVLAIVAVIAGVAALSVGGVGSRAGENAARRAQALLELACERAALTGRDIGVAVVEDGLRFGYLTPQGFRLVGDDPADPLRARPLGEGLVLTLEREGEVLPAVADPPATPQLACLGSGEMTPFRLDIAREGEPVSWVLAGSLDGTLTLERSDDAR